MERRLIDADALALELFNKAQNTRKRYTTPDGYLSLPWGVIADGIEQAIQSVDQAPAIDAVEVVRCRECKHRKDPFVCPMCGECVAPEGEDWGIYDWAEDDGFCHKGERREPDGE